jgi:hypothetical protein
MTLACQILDLACYTLGTVYYGYQLSLIVRSKRNKSKDL